MSTFQLINESINHSIMINNAIKEKRVIIIKLKNQNCINIIYNILFSELYIIYDIKLDGIIYKEYINYNKYLLIFDTKENKINTFNKLKDKFTFYNILLY
jgi:hypothetical protein